MSGENVRSTQRGIVTGRRCWSNSPFSCLSVLAQAFGSESLCCCCCSDWVCCCERVGRFCKALVVAVDTLQYILLLFDDITFSSKIDCHTIGRCRKPFMFSFNKQTKRNKMYEQNRYSQTHSFLCVCLICYQLFDRFPQHWHHLGSEQASSPFLESRASKRGSRFWLVLASIPSRS